jgi:hypothetical protein
MCVCSLCVLQGLGVLLYDSGGLEESDRPMLQVRALLTSLTRDLRLCPHAPVHNAILPHFFPPFF